MDSDKRTKMLTFAIGTAFGAGMMMLRKRIVRPVAIKSPKMILHIYDHCPFCIRVELVLGWKGIPYERKVYGYGDSLGDPNKGEYYGGITLTGKKQLPVLEVEGKSLMPESGDIIAYLERLQGPGKVLLPPAFRKDLKNFFQDAAFKQSARILTRPLKLKMTHLKDWAKSEDIKYAKEKYEGQGFDYDGAEASFEKHIDIMNGFLEQLDKMIYSPESLSEGPCSQTWDDVHYLPELRTLSMVDGLKWPKKLHSYVMNSLNNANVSSYFHDQKRPIS